MSAFEIIVTPTHPKNKKRLESREPTEVIMAPFSAKAIVQFEDVPLTKTAKRILRIINPTEDDIEVTVTKPIKPEHNVTIDWSTNVVPAYNEIKMEMVWSPQMDVACKDTMQITDNRNFRKDVMIILKSKTNKTFKTVRKYPTVSSGNSASGGNGGTYVKTLRLKSPTSSIKSNSRFVSQAPTRKHMQAKIDRLPPATKARPQWNDAMPKHRETLQKRTEAAKSVPNIITPLTDRNTYIRDHRVEHIVRDSSMGEVGNNLSPAGASVGAGGRGEKENISPLTPVNVINLIDKINFTPATDKVQNTCPRYDNLASWPTPISAEHFTDEVEHKSLSGIRPRRLIVAELSEVDAKMQLKVDDIVVSEVHSNTTTIITNKTFEVKRSSNITTTDTFDTSTVAIATVDILDKSLNSAATTSASTVTTLNKTTTITSTTPMRHLEIIQEEDGPTDEHSPQKLQKTYTKTCSGGDAEQDLKRDIRLVGTPLRKYSESMKNLSLQTPPQTKLSIQGSMPNLNEMENIRSIEQNRYFFQSSSTSSNQMLNTEATISVKHELNTQPSVESEHRQSFDDSANGSNSSTVSHAEVLFNQNEILAQSSRFNLNEIGLKSRKNSPVASKTNTVTNKNCTASSKMSPTTNRNSPAASRYSPSANRNSLAASRYSPASKPNIARKLITNRSDKKTITPEKQEAIISHKRPLHELSFSDSPSMESITSSCSSTRVRTAKTVPPVSPPKRQRFDNPEASFQRPRVKSWTQAQPKKLKLAKTLSLVKRPITPRKLKEEPRIKLYDSELYLQSHINPDPFAATTTCDPFLASTMYLDENAVDRHQCDFKKWLNALVSIPADLDADCNTKVDVGKLFNEVRHKELTLAVSKETQSMNYLTKFRLESLRRAAIQLFLSEEMRVPCSKVAVYVNKNAIRIRSDRNLHLDVVMQRYILELLLCFNPLWLRLGLEVVYGEKININSNNDIVGLSTFILNRLFRDKLLEQKYSKAYTLSDEYADHIKKFTLQKILFLLLFLDTAKEKHIITHNPCLFVKKSPFKETKEILLKFSTELLANVGDITRDLKRLGYMLQHKQTFLDEFDYAFHNLAVDLRDGIRLTRVMEIILLRNDLSKQLRVPAISRLQRIFNVNLALRSLSEADFQLTGDISGADIVDGHREKTLSLLWQIIYKFRSPKFHAAARVLQKWWRHSWLRVVIQRRIRDKELKRRDMAASRIQAAFRGYTTRMYLRVVREEHFRAAITLQKYVRRYLAQRQLRKGMTAVVRIQRWYRACVRGVDCRQRYLRLRECTVFLQRCMRRKLLARNLLQTAREIRLQREQRRHAASACIQYRWRAYSLMKLVRQQYQLQRKNAITLQRRFRAQREMQQKRHEYLCLLKATSVVQRRFRAQKLMLEQRARYLQQRNCIVKLQQRRKALLVTRQVRAEYVQQRMAVISVQRHLRATLAMRQQRVEYLKIIASTCTLQRRWRAQLAMQQQLNSYTHVRQCVIFIQLKWRATLLARRVRIEYISLQYHTTVLQQKFRATRQMRIDAATYQRFKAAVTWVQRLFRGKLRMQQERAQFLRKMQAIHTVQRRFHAYKQMRFTRAKYQGTRTATICLQQHIRAYLLMKHERKRFLQQQQACIVLQRTFRAYTAMQVQRRAYVELKTEVICVQRRYRAIRQMRQQQCVYAKQRQLIVTMQRRYRAKLLARKVRSEYVRKHELIIFIQRLFRAQLDMRSVRAEYLTKQAAVIQIQRYYRAFTVMKRQKEVYRRQRCAAIFLQRWYRSVLHMRNDQRAYQYTRSKCMLIQRKWRATLAAHQERAQYLRTVQQIITIQQKWRATLRMRINRARYQLQRSAAITLQRRFRAHRNMLKMRSQYLLIHSLIICVQRKFRAHRAMLKQRHEYVELKRITVYLQQKYRGRIEMRVQRAQYELLKRVTVQFQAQARGFLARKRFKALMTPEMVEYLRHKKAAKMIQRFWRGYCVRKRFRNVSLLQIRRNIALLKQTSSAVNSISSKMKDAVRILRTRSSASEMLHVLMRLERISRTVPHLLMCHSDFISTFCYDIMAQTIRSEVDKQLIRYCSRTILNLARYNSTTANTFQEGGLVTIAQMLLRWCDKDCEIFNALCTLIWIFSHCPQKRKIIRDFMTTPEAIYVVRETKKLVARKDKMNQNARKPIVPISRSGVQLQTNFSSRALPSLEPDYGVIHNKPYTFISSVYAFDTILCKLGIDIF